MDADLHWMVVRYPRFWKDKCWVIRCILRLRISRAFVSSVIRPGANLLLRHIASRTEEHFIEG